MDVTIALVAIVLLAPLMLVVTILIRLTMGGPVIFAHHRIGHNGQLFPCFKFRTMVANADEVLARHLAVNPAAAREWRETMKLRNDPRVTFLGRLFRKSSIDELPQLVNVLRGEMSCVGPRPIVAEELPRYDIHLPEYLIARPGLTGAWQVSGRNNLDYAQRVALDCAYIRNWSIWLDLVILSRTIFVLMKFDEAS
jgi:exopolysaccharide production protein ExoY